MFNNLQSSADGANYYAQFRSSTSYLTASSHKYSGGGNDSGASSFSGMGAGDVSAIKVTLDGSNNTARKAKTIFIWLDNPAQTTYVTNMRWFECGLVSDGNFGWSAGGGVNDLGTPVAMDGFKLYPDSGTFVTGTLHVYGLKLS